MNAGVGTNRIAPLGLTCTVCPGIVTSVRTAPVKSTAVTEWLPSIVWLSVILASLEKLSTLPEPLIPMTAFRVVILNKSLLKLAIAPVNARIVPFSREREVLLDASGVPVKWNSSMRISVSARTAMKAPSLKRNCAIPSRPETIDSPASTSPPRTALRSLAPTALTTRTSPVTKLNLPALARLSPMPSRASKPQSASRSIKLNLMMGIPGCGANSEVVARR